MQKKKPTDEPRFLDAPIEEPEPDRLEKVWRAHLPEEPDPNYLDSGFAYPEPATIDSIKRQLRGESEPDRINLERMLSNHSNNIPDEERQYLTQLAHKVGLHLPIFKPSRAEIITILEDLGQEGFALKDYTRMNDEVLSAYYQNVQVDIGMYIWKIDSDVIRAVWAKKREEAKQKVS